MRTALDFITPECKIEGQYKLNEKKYNLGVQPDNSVCFIKENDKTVYHGYIFKKGFAIGAVPGAKIV